MKSAEISPAAFAVLVDRAGLSLSPDQAEDLRIAYKNVMEMATRVRRPRSRADEPAHTFSLPLPPSET